MLRSNPGPLGERGQLVPNRSRPPARWRPADGTVPVRAGAGLAPRSLRPASSARRRLCDPCSPVWLPCTRVERRGAEPETRRASARHEAARGDHLGG